MTKGIDLSIAADTRSAMSAIKSGLIGPLDDVSELLEHVGTDSKDTGRDLEKSMRDAQRRTVDAKDEISDLRDELRRAGRAGREAGNEAGDGLGRVKEGAQEVTQEVGQNLGQAVSSFRGDMTDLAQVGQDTLGGLAASVAAVPGFGIPAAVALAAGAAGWGIMTQNQEELKKRQEEINELASKMAEAYIDSAGKAASAVAILAASNDQLNTNLEEVKKNAGAWGVDNLTAARAMVGDVTALAIVQGNLNDKQAEWAEVLKKSNAAGEETWHDNMDLTQSQKDLRDRLHEGQDAYEKFSASQQLAAEQGALTAKNIYEIATASGIATGKVDDLGNRIVQMPDGAEIVIDAKTKTASQNVDAFENNYKTKFKNLSDYNNALIRSAGKVAVEVDKVGNKVVTLPSGKQIFIDAKTHKASEDISRFQGDVDKKIDHLNGRTVAPQVKVDQAEAHARKMRDYMLDRVREMNAATVNMKLKPDTSALDAKIRDLQRGISLPVRVYQRGKFVAVIP